MARRRNREPRTPPTAMPATFAEVDIQVTVSDWRGRIDQRITSAASHRFIEADLLRQLELHEQGCPALEPSDIVAMADGGHPPADHALLGFIKRRMDADRFQQMPVSVRDFARRSIGRAPLPIEYPSQASQVVSHFARDIATCMLVDMVKARWPELPQLYSTLRHRSAAHYVGAAFGIAERQAVRIYDARGEMGRRLATFMVGYANLSG
jgi:hypothetical protein